MRNNLIAALLLITPCLLSASVTNQRSAAPAAGATTSADALAAKRVAERYYQLIERKKFAAARSLWDHGGADSGGNAAALAASFARFATFAASVGEPTEIKRQGNVHYIAVAAKAKVTERRTGRVYVRQGAVLLRRNSVSGGQNGAWRIWGTDLREKH